MVRPEWTEHLLLRKSLSSAPCDEFSRGVQAMERSTVLSLETHVVVTVAALYLRRLPVVAAGAEGA